MKLQTRRTAIIGIDCATVDAKVGLCMAIADANKCEVQAACTCPRGSSVAKHVVGWLSGHDRTLLAFDAPLGWPLGFGEVLVAHEAGEYMASASNDLFRRSTDRHVKDTLNKQSLDVGADRIARTAHWALRLIFELRQTTGLAIPLAWNEEFSDAVAAIEVYPAATLKAHGIEAKEYKKPKNLRERMMIIDRLGERLELPEDLVCVLAGHDFLRGAACKPPDLKVARKEGWIWVRPLRTE